MSEEGTFFARAMLIYGQYLVQWCIKPNLAIRKKYRND